MTITESRHAGEAGHVARIETVNRRTNGTKTWQVWWRERTWRCCGETIGKQGTEPPVNDFDADSAGGLTPRLWECGRCGSLQSAQVRIQPA